MRRTPLKSKFRENISEDQSAKSLPVDSNGSPNWGWSSTTPNEVAGRQMDGDRSGRTSPIDSWQVEPAVAKLNDGSFASSCSWRPGACSDQKVLSANSRRKRAA